MLEMQVNEAFEILLKQAHRIKGLAIAVIDADGAVGTTLSYPTDMAITMLGALDLAKDQIKAKLTIG